MLAKTLYINHTTRTSQTFCDFKLSLHITALLCSRNNFRFCVTVSYCFVCCFLTSLAKEGRLCAIENNEGLFSARIIFNSSSNTCFHLGQIIVLMCCIASQICFNEKRSL